VADGKIIIDTALDPKGFKEGLEGLQGQAKKSGGSIMAAFAGGGLISGGISKAIGAISESIGGAITRLDTLNQFPKVMSNLGIATDEAKAAIDKMSDKLTGLPTTLDSAAGAVASLTSKNGDVGKSTDMFLALNDALLAGGQPMEIQQTAMEQLSQSYAKGKPDMMEWRSAMTAMPAQLKQTADAMGFVDTNALGESLRNGETSMDDFMEALIRLDKEGTGEFKSFAEQAKNATGGIGTSIATLKTSVTRGLATVMDSINKSLEEAGVGGISGMMSKTQAVITKAFKSIAKAGAYAGPAVKVLAQMASKAKGLIKPTLLLVAGFKALKITRNASSWLNTFANAQYTAANGVKTLSLAENYAAASATKLTAARRIALKASSAQVLAEVANGAAVEGSIIQMAAARTATVTLSVAQKAQAASAAVATTATRALSAAFAANPIGLIIMGVTTVISLLMALGVASEETERELSEHGKEVQALAEKYGEAAAEMRQAAKDRAKDHEAAISDARIERDESRELIASLEEISNKTKKTTKDKKELAKVVEDLNEKYPDLNLEYDKEKDKLSKSTDEIRKYIEAKNDQALAEAAYERKKEALKARGSAVKDLREAEKTYNAQETYLDTLERKWGYVEEKIEANAQAQREAQLSALTSIGPPKTLIEISDDEQNGLNELQDVRAGVDELKTSVEELRSSVDDFDFEIADGDTISNNIEVVNSAIGELGDKFPQTLRDRIKEGEFGVVTSLKQIKKLIKAQKIIDGAQLGDDAEAAMQTIADGLKSGQIKVADAAKEARALVNFKGLGEPATEEGKEAMALLTAGIEMGEALPSEALAAAMEMGIGTVAEKAGPLSDAARNALEQAQQEAERKASDSQYIGISLDDGVAEGIYDGSGKVVTSAAWLIVRIKAAMLAKAEIQSPSRLFARAIGGPIAQGVAVGILRFSGVAASAATSLVQSTIAAARASVAKGDFSGVGKDFTDALSEAVGEQSAAGEKALQKNLDANLEAAQKAEDKAQTKVDKAKDKYDKAKDKYGKSSSEAKSAKAALTKAKATLKAAKSEIQAIEEANKEILDAYKKANDEEIDQLKELAKEKIEELSDEYQRQYDELVSKQESMRANLMKAELMVAQSAGLTAVSGLRDVDAGNLSRSLTKNLKDLEKYEAGLNAVKGKIPDDLMAEVLKLSVPEANAMLKKLQKMDDAALADYLSKWKTEQQKIEQLQAAYGEKQVLSDLGDDVAALKNYQANVAALKGKIPQSLMDEILGMDTEKANAYMDQLNAMSTKEFQNYVNLWKQKETLASSISGAFYKNEIAQLKATYQAELQTQLAALQKQMTQIGKNTAQGFIDGLNAAKGDMSKAMKKICDQIIKDTKKKFGIASPSRVFASIAQRNLQGFSSGFRKEAPKMLRDADQIHADLVKRLSDSGIDMAQIGARMRAAVWRDVSRMPLSAVERSSALQSGGGGGTIAIDILPGEVSIDGRAAGKQLARHIDVELDAIDTQKRR
jgi:tape measure domain-containing protein